MDQDERLKDQQCYNLDPCRDMNVYTKFYHNISNRCWDKWLKNTSLNLVLVLEETHQANSRGCLFENVLD